MTKNVIADTCSLASGQSATKAVMARLRFRLG